MYSTIADFLEDWAYESDVTLKTVKELTDQSLQQRVSPTGRTLGKIAWHVVATIGEMLQAAQLDFVAPADDKAIPATAAEFYSAYELASNNFKTALPLQWKDETLDDEIILYGQPFSRRKVLSMLVKHQIHHRAQMTVLMRQAGLRVPGAYGPSLEEWAQYGAPAAE
jgi:uncharacterized damage-inducible protein DinB